MNDAYTDDLITVDELCDMLMIGKNMAYRLLNSGDIAWIELQSFLRLILKGK